ncbi:PPOX class F420-dependent oxidoreductase [Streptomyces sp. NPDC047097]|uniref:PPOX class F420-dependent oxidoreductase n=1 Tax=Streptomyces sp. NPDC047097 TaxID=3155260 RepID=UPI0033D2F9ED
MTPETLRHGRYLSLTTFRKDGTGVATPVWYAVDGDDILVWTNSDSWKVKRLRRDQRVIVAPCDLRGNVADDAPRAEGTARLLETDELKRVRRLLSRKYSWQFWLIDAPAAVFRRGKRPHTGIAVRLTAEKQP